MKKLVVVLAVVALAGAACANNEQVGPEEAPLPDATQSPAAAEVNDHGTKTFTTESFEAEIELDNFYFAPTFIKAPGASTAKLELFNEGSATHTFTIDALSVDEELAPEARETIEVELGTETRYEFYCRFHGDQGMRGAFTLH